MYIHIYTHATSALQTRHLSCHVSFANTTPFYFTSNGLALFVKRPGDHLSHPHSHPLLQVPTFFRRPSWSPDGCLLVTPTGLHKGEHDHKAQFVTHVFARDKFDKCVHSLRTATTI